MNQRIKQFAASLSLIALTLGLSRTSGAASSGQAETAVLVAAAALTGGQIIFTSSTGSKLEIDVDVYDPHSNNPRVAKLFELDHALALRSAMRPSDPVTHPTPRSLMSVRDALLPEMAEVQHEQTILA